MTKAEQHLKEVLDELREALLNGSHSSAEKNVDGGISVTVSESFTEEGETKTFTGQGAVVLVLDGEGIHSGVLGAFSTNDAFAVCNALDEVKDQLLGRLAKAKAKKLVGKLFGKKGE